MKWRQRQWRQYYYFYSNEAVFDYSVKISVDIKHLLFNTTLVFLRKTYLFKNNLTMNAVYIIIYKITDRQTAHFLIIYEIL